MRTNTVSRRLTAILLSVLMCFGAVALTVTTLFSVFPALAVNAADVQDGATSTGDEDTYPGYVSVAQPITNIIGDISFIRDINTADELEAMMKADALPAIAMYQMDADLNILDEKGGKISTVADVLTKTEFKVLSAFCTDDLVAAENFTDYLNANAFYDCFIVSSDPAVVNAARTAAPAISGVIDFRHTYKNAEELTEEQCIEIRRIIKKNNAYIALLPAEVCSNETVQYLYVRQVNVWAGCAASATDIDLYATILSGAVGVMSDKTETLLDIACNKLSSNTMTRVTPAVGHRGNPGLAPENTLEGSLYAYEMGANVIELDIYITTDGHVVVIHDETTGRTYNENRYVEASTLAELKELSILTNNAEFADCKLPTLEEYLQAFKDKDCNLFIEIKSQKREIISAMKALIDQYDMYDQCTVITFYESILRYMREDYPEMHGGFLCGDIMAGANAEAGLREAMNTVGPINASINPSYGGYDDADLRAALRRGISIYPWTFRGDITAYMPHLLWGYSGLTGDSTNVLGRCAKVVEYTGKTTYTVGESRSLAINVTNYKRLTEAKKATLTILEGEEHVNVTDTALEFVSDGTVTILLSYFQRLDRKNGYYLHTAPITITVTSETETETPDATAEDTNIPSDETNAETNSSDESGCASALSANLLWVLLPLGALAVCRRRKD